MKRAIIPGSFDPITIGHCDLIEKSSKIFDEIIIAVGNNIKKKYMFTLEQRTNFIKNLYEDNKKIIVKNYTGLTVDFCKKMDSNFLIRGIRNTTDFEYEKEMAQINFHLTRIETIFLTPSYDKAHISSSFVKEIIKNKGDFKKYLPSSVKL
tara:strand:+ start:166 stop:618 length:453 start_codon:yes stop_codon:yes gene_type:complete